MIIIRRLCNVSTVPHDCREDSINAALNIGAHADTSSCSAGCSAHERVPGGSASNWHLTPPFMLGILDTCSASTIIIHTMFLAPVALHALHGYTVSIMKSPGPDGRILTENNDALTCLAYVGNDPYAPSSTRSAQLRMYTTARKGPPDTFHIT